MRSENRHLAISGYLKSGEKPKKLSHRMKTGHLAAIVLEALICKAYLILRSIERFSFRNGPSALSPPIPGLNSGLCGVNITDTIRSSSNRLYMKFRLSYRQPAFFRPIDLAQSATPGVMFSIRYEEIAGGI